MKILGINFSHDASVAYIENGQVKNAVEEEKISRIKQDFGWPKNAVEAILRQNKVYPEEIDVIAFGSMFFNEIGSNEIKYRFSKKNSDKNKEIIDRITAYLRLSSKKISKENEKIFEDELRGLGFINAKIEFYNHHLCHAVSALFCAPFIANLVVTCDGHGDGESFNFYVPDEIRGLKLVRSNNYQSSVGQFYSAVTKLLGFRPTRHEGKITGLAAFGKDTILLQKFRNLFNYQDGILRRFPFGQEAQLWEAYQVARNLKLSAKINLNTSESDIGIRYGKNGHILLGWLKENTVGFSKEDIAFACQQVTEEVILKELSIVIEQMFGKEKVSVALAGGVFANVRVNQKVYEHPSVKNIFVQPAMGDSGLALGAGIWADISYGNRGSDDNKFVLKDTYLGIEYNDELDLFLKNIDTSLYKIRKMAQPPKEVALLISRNKIVGFWHGSMEWGPRALGRRSILLNTFDKKVNDTLNERLNRTEFMPFAPSVLDKVAKEYFPDYVPTVSAADFMTITYNVDPKYYDILQAVTHVDGTARPQIVKREINEYYYDIIDEFYKISNCGALVNTSFNAHEEPIVNSPEVALKGLKENRIDFLVLENYLIERIS